jgi:hypothetical protein
MWIIITTMTAQIQIVITLYEYKYLKIITIMQILLRVMIHYHLNIQLFTILHMWQNSKSSGGPPYHVDKMIKNYIFK